MKFFEILQRHRLLVHYITIIVVICGFVTISKIQREARPNVNFNRVAVSVAFPGASPSDIEELVVDPIEEKISEVDGIKEYRSVSYSGAGAISIEIDDEYPDQEKVVEELRQKIAEVKDLPIEVNDPMITEIKAISIPVLRLAIFGELSPFNLKLEVEKLRDYLKTFKGVQSVNYTGLEDLQLKILSDPDKLNQNDITLIEIINSLQRWSRQRPGGLFESGSQTANITVGSDYSEVKKLDNFVVRTNDALRSIKLSDLAKVDYDLESTQKVSLYGARNAVLLTIVKKPFEDAVSTVDEVKAALTQYKKSLPKELDYKFYTDESKRVRDRLSIVSYNALFGLFLVLVLLILFLDWRSAVVTSAGIPVALLGGIVIVYLLGNTMNSLVLIGIIIVLGMLVDDAIVVCENIYSHLEEGLSPLNASIKGVTQIATPVIATVLTTVFAFFPILFMKEIMGQFLRVIPITVIAMLSVSLFEALVILPVHAKEIMKPIKRKRQSRFLKLESIYEKYLNWSLKHRFIVLGVMLLISVASFFQGKSLFQRFTLFPATGLNGLTVRVELPKNSPLNKTVDAVKALNQRLENISEDTFESHYATIGEVRTGGQRGSLQNASHLGMVDITFTSDPTFINKEKKIVEAITEAAKIFSAESGVKTSITLDRPGPPIGKPIQLQITSRDLEYGNTVVEKIKGELTQIKGVHSLETDLDGDSIKYRFEVNNLFATSAGINPLDISKTVFAASTGVVVTEILKNNEKVELLVGIKKKENFTPKEILKLKILSGSGRSISIGNFITIIEERGPSSIQRLNGLRTVTLFGEVDEKFITGKEANAKIGPFLAKLKTENPTVKIETAGGAKSRMLALADTGRLYVFALLLIFMIISLAFKSFLYPFLVLTTIPMGLCGVVWALTLHGVPFSLMGIIGMVGLSGVVVNISIILLKFVQEKVENGSSLNVSLIEAGKRRLRPVIITTITTLVGLAPTIYGNFISEIFGVGGFDAFIHPLALVLGWGLLVATILTLLVLPALTSFFTVLEKKLS